MKMLDAPQGTEQWRRDRLARPTCSQLHRIIGKSGKRSTQSGAYLAELLTEWIIEAPADPASFQSQYMDRGTKQEKLAIGRYEWDTGLSVTHCGLCVRDDDLLAGSPDGLVGADGGVEIKTPGIVTHVDYMLNGFDDYTVQIQGLLFVTGRKWWDAFSFNTTLGAVRVRHTPDAEFHEQIEDALKRFDVRFKEAKERFAKYKQEKAPEIKAAIASEADDTGPF